MQDNLLMQIIKNNYMEVLVCSYIGDREDQQDAVYASLLQDKLIAIVADGMGGLNNGRCASNTAVRTLKQLFENCGEGQNMQSFYYNAIKPVDKAVYDTRLDSNKSGTTLVSATVTGDSLDWLSIGDSRLYMLRDNSIIQLNKDHTLKNYLEKNKDNPEVIASLGEIDELKLEALTSYVGMGGITFYDINTKKCKLKSKDCILITTDGLYKGIPDDEMCRIIFGDNDLQRVGTELLRVAQVNAGGNQDNTTFVLAKYL